MEIGSTVGKWTAFVPVGHSARVELHLFKKEHPGQYHREIRGGELCVDRVPTMEVVKFILAECPEGEFAPGAPALACDAFNMENDVKDFMQAIVNEAAKLGIYAAGTKDLTREVAALKGHLEDMRRIALAAYPLLVR